MVTPQNDFYGHRRILNDYMGVRPGARFRGALQHGWHLEPGYQGASPSRFVPYFVWAERHLDPDHPATIIGAPFLYHREVRAGIAPGPADRILVMPYHGDGVDLDDAHAVYADHLEGLRRDANQITVCLHPSEFDGPIRVIYERHGYDVVTNGVRLDDGFLDSYLHHVRQHGVVTSNRMSTGLLFAAVLGRTMFVRGPFARSADTAMADIPYDRQYELYQQAFPTVADGVSGADAVALGRRELGADHVREPNELAELLGSTGIAQVGARLVAGANAVRRRRPGRRQGPSDAAVGRTGTAVASLRVIESSRDQPERTDR